MKHILIVESKNDKVFFEFLLHELSIIEVNIELVGLDKVEGRRGLSYANLKCTLE